MQVVSMNEVRRLMCSVMEMRPFKLYKEMAMSTGDLLDVE